ncbi:CbtA family protein [Amycolatopsis umgeniensis]|uniref:Putative cobalt transporter CbtA n=1 Tax=Amycolatopsis umgeniensis TaxID=336628 RepID=A0A841BAB3_9PSEU|nr:CbtA family protein [Amycolatopsis umgeniensis]MBB5855860.1 putative cobalt transporter CbtA [Amycolatopsis umgeniensis]
MMRSLLVRGMLAGLIAGVLATLFAYFFGEPSVETAIGLEGTAAHSHDDAGAHDPAAHDPAAHEPAPAEEEELVTRGVQSTVGLLTGVGLYGVAVGGLFSLAFAFVYGRLGTLRPRVTAALLAGGAFVVVFLVPFLKYPANPPAVGQAGTIGSRTSLYFGFVALSLLIGILAAAFGRKLADKLGAWRGGLIAAGGYVVLIAVAAALLPSIDEVPAEFPGSTLWTFRLASVGTQVVLWTVLGLAFGALSEKALSEKALTEKSLVRKDA